MKNLKLMLPLLGALAVSGCDLDLQSPAILTYEDVDADLLVNGAVESWMTGWNSAVISEWYASDEAIALEGASDSWRTLDETGDLTLHGTYYQGYALAEFLDGREEARFAVQRAEEALALANDSLQIAEANTALRRAKAYRGWFITGLARRRGDQPIQPEGPVLTQEEQYQRALEHFQDVVELSNESRDSLHLHGLAGTARLQWMLGRDPVDAERLEQAIAAAEQVLSLQPAYMWALEWPFGYIASYHVRFFNSAVVSPAFENIPYPADDFANPAGDMFTDADGLWLIIAESHLLMGEVEEAREALKSVPLLATNNVGLAGRDPNGAPLTQSEIDAYIDSLDPAGLQFVIDELRRENFYLRGRRNVGPEGAPIWPVPLPPEALEG